jgi:hypothetical protein
MDPLEEPTMPYISADIPYHQQDSSDYCGAAAAQMVLAGLGRGTFKQSDIYRGNPYRLAQNTGMSPDELVDALNRKLPWSDQFQRYFDSRDRGYQRIAATLAAKKTGVPVMVEQTNHWNVVTGVQLEHPPADGTQYAIKGFYVHEPEPITAAVRYGKCPGSVVPPPEKPPMPHTTPDHCGCGESYGSKHTYITKYEWEKSYWKDPTTVYPGHRGYVSLSNLAEPQLARSSDDSPRAVREAADERTPLEATRFDGDFEGAVGQAIREHGIDQEGPLADRIRGFEVREEAGLVDMLVPTSDQRFFSLMRDGEQVGRALFDTSSRELLMVQAPPSTLGPPDRMLQFVEEVLANELQLLSDLLEPRFQRPAFTVYPAYVWRPCRQSMSRFNPFIQVHFPGAIIYVGMDRRVHRRLDPHS